MEKIIKLYHYTFSAVLGKNVCKEYKIYKECILGVYNSSKNSFYQECLDWKINLEDTGIFSDAMFGKDSFQIDYYTIDEINGYDKFIEYVFYLILNRNIREKAKIE